MKRELSKNRTSRTSTSLRPVRLGSRVGFPASDFQPELQPGITYQVVEHYGSINFVPSTYNEVTHQRRKHLSGAYDLSLTELEKLLDAADNAALVWFAKRVDEAKSSQDLRETLKILNALSRLSERVNRLTQVNVRLLTPEVQAVIGNLGSDRIALAIRSQQDSDLKFRGKAGKPVRTDVATAATVKFLYDSWHASTNRPVTYEKNTRSAQDFFRETLPELKVYTRCHLSSGGETREYIWRPNSFAQQCALQLSAGVQSWRKAGRHNRPKKRVS